MARRGRILTAAALVAAIQLSLLWIYYVPAAKALAGDERAYRAKAVRLLAGTPIEPDLWPPFYAYFLVPLLALDDGALWPVQAAQLALLIAIALLLRDLAGRMIGRGVGADLAGLLVLLHPPLVAFGHYLWPEVLHLALFLGATWIVVARRRQLRWMPLLGLLLGLALITKSLLLGFVPVLLLPVLIAGDGARGALRTAVAIALLAVTVTPTVLANHRAHGHWSIGNSAWFNLWVGLQDTSPRSLLDPVVIRSYREYLGLDDTQRGRDARLREEIAAYLDRRGLTGAAWRQLRSQYFRLLDKDSYLTAQLPGGELARHGQGYAGPRRPITETLRYLSYLLYGAVLAAAAAGVVWSEPRRRPWLWLALAFLAYNAVLFLALHVKSRFRVQVLPFLFLFAGLACDRLRARHSHTTGAGGSRIAPARLALAGGAAGLALFLAFGAPLLE